MYEIAQATAAPPVIGSWDRGELWRREPPAVRFSLIGFGCGQNSIHRYAICSDSKQLRAMVWPPKFFQEACRHLFAYKIIVGI